MKAETITSNAVEVPIERPPAQTKIVASSAVRIAIARPVKASGDLDGDGNVGLKDAMLALRAAVGLQVLLPQQALSADMNGDGLVTMADVLLILHMPLR